MSNLTGKDRYMQNRVSEFKTAIVMYYRYLHLMGQTENCDPYRLLMTMHIDEIFNGKLSGFITAEDYRIMDKVLRNITGAGLMPYHVWRSQFAQVFSATSTRRPARVILKDYFDGKPIPASEVDTLAQLLKDIPPDYNDFIIDSGTAKDVL